MLSSIYIGLSGLSAYSQGLQRISGNVANLNAQGFKGSNVSFQSVMGEAGFGDGVRNATDQTNFSQGELRQTSRDLDLAIDGTGFLVLQRGEETVYTRTGSFEVNSDGFVVLSGTEYRLATLDANGKAQAVSIDAVRTSKPSATTKITMADNLSSSATTFSVSDVKVYDPSGGQHTWQLTFDKDQSSAAGPWNVTIKDEAGTTVATKPITFTNGVIDSQSAQVSIADAAHGFTVNLDLTGVTSFSSGTVSTLRAASSDGFTTGTLTSVTVNTDGQLELGYSNSQKSQVGNVAIAEFRNPEALKQRSGGLFTSSGDSQRTIVQSGDPRVGKIQSRRLEASNVDLTTEFSDLILVQRGFQASSQIISVSNEMIQQLFGIRGQG
ncbi:hypothetical protein AQZ52_17485 [Novosphingobium fuchskuhlense]|uniref:Flagellar hook protein FlgE n=1 Tax=Novosphingobium fuchskuhlense TaxID=1117702 RepID=A0A117US81_9SPHN|nr:flagellar hook-basal body complex protein [Novosphingobium fuchskuhlense]KUR69895.1 hypothetical protein AQZ52_17485 [Novosphingobium fuchskuhlense]